MTATHKRNMYCIPCESIKCKSVIWDLYSGDCKYVCVKCREETTNIKTNSKDLSGCYHPSDFYSKYPRVHSENEFCMVCFSLRCKVVDWSQYPKECEFVCVTCGMETDSLGIECVKFH